MSRSIEITQLLSGLVDGNQSTVDKLFPLVYEELRMIARRQMRSERPDHTLHTTDLVHEAYINLVKQDSTDWKNRSHFFGIASLAMRRILINYANQRLTQKRGSGAQRVNLDDFTPMTELRAQRLLDLDEALLNLEKLNERQAKVVTLKFFGGLKHEEIAEALGLSVPSIRRDWRFAKAWLANELDEDTMAQLDEPK